MTSIEPIKIRMQKSTWTIREMICQAIEKLDGGRFESHEWTRSHGGQEMTLSDRVISGSSVFERAAVNHAIVRGTFSPELAQAATGHKENGGEPKRFFATGVSLVLHPVNPMVPSTHANFRFFQLEDDGKPGSWWFGGGADLTPYYLFEEDVVHFHSKLKEVCDRHDVSFYPRFKKWCDDYFYNAHRAEHRGVGGIFFDNLNETDQEGLYTFVTSCAAAFLPAYLPIVEARMALPFTDANKHWQRLRWGRYVEFDLMYDRGSLFGLKAGVQPDSILMALPPVACWEYGHQPAPSSDEVRLVEILQNPRDWV